ncbi:MAG: transcriptional regulator [Chitinophagales bacterium]|nr:transcriptional regulator [Chitinophagales bacterium]
MEKFILEKDLKVFGVEVENFPEGIGDAFDKLVNMISGEVDRSYFGISITTDKGFSYKAVAEEKYDGETENYNCDRYIIEKGEYLSVTLNDWRKKTDSIKDIFHEMFHNAVIDKTKPCVEWYKNDDEMLCMVRIDQSKE